MARTQEERDKLVMQFFHLPLHIFLKLRRRYEVRKLGRDDAVQAGFMGLLRAAAGWQEDRGVKFISYAYVAVQRAILDEAKRTGICSTKSTRRRTRRLRWEDVAFICDQVDRRDDVHFGQCLLRRMSTQEQEIVWSHLQDGRMFKDIAVDLGSTLGSVQNRYRRAIHRVRRQLTGDIHANASA